MAQAPKIFSHKLTFATALFTTAKKFLTLDFLFSCFTLSKQGSWALFWPMDDSAGEWV